MTAMLERGVIAPLARRDWGDDAACRTEDVSLFYGSGKVPLTGKAALPGRAVCSRCPVRRDCLIDAVRKREFIGMRAGFLGHELRHTLETLGWSVADAVAAYDAGAFHQPRRRT